ncbi:uncharacterized protein LOC130919236 isoform X2 [Corythoichthys intestinalis]|uniref:uncharacterized protein LOC130919236 isoform X2 n=1 Tax=Corythoichthys intestinalis TaxID=161448 RepID=UPI0025A4DB52|nr:uncharacterized protein LOC130919236 isoform X2 [Corythoichthys intestinalis]
MAARSKELLRDHLVHRLVTRLTGWLKRVPLDMDYLEFIICQDLVVLDAISTRLNVPQGIVDGLRDIYVMVCNVNRKETNITVARTSGRVGRPKILIPKEHTLHLLDVGLSVATIAQLFGVSRRTLHRHTAQWGYTVQGSYSSLTDEELDSLVSEMHTSNPNAGYRMMKGLLKAQGHKVQWERVRSSMHRVDTSSIVSRMPQLRFGVRRTFSVPSPKSLMHIDTNHKLVRYNIVIFGGIDGYSRKIMYLRASNNNLASTTMAFFREAVEMFGIPLRVQGDHCVENVDVARFMFSVRGTGRSSFIAGKSSHNQRMERLWRDVFSTVTSRFHDTLHQLEEEGHLDLSSNLHIFSCHYAFIPLIQRQLDIFRDGWDDHPLRTEGNLSPNQLWQLNPSQECDEDVQIPLIDWDNSGLIPSEPNSGIAVPQIECPFTAAELAGLTAAVDPQTSSNLGVDNFFLTLDHMHNIGYV